NAVRDAQPAHVGFLRRRAVEQAVKTPAEIIVGLRRLVFYRLVLEFFVAVERMQLALEFFRVRELAAGLDDAVLGAQARGVGPGGLERGTVCLICRGAIADCRARRFRDLQSGHKSFQIALLFWLKISRHSAFRLLTTSVLDDSRCAIPRA